MKCGACFFFRCVGVADPKRYSTYIAMEKCRDWSFAFVCTDIHHGHRNYLKRSLRRGAHLSRLKDRLIVSGNWRIRRIYFEMSRKFLKKEFRLSRLTITYVPGIGKSDLPNDAEITAQYKHHVQHDDTIINNNRRH